MSLIFSLTGSEQEFGALPDLLRQRGHTILFSTSLKNMEDESFDVVFTEPGMGMPVERVHEIRPYAVVIYIVGYSAMDQAMQALEDGAADFLRRPLKIQELNAAIIKAERLVYLTRERERMGREQEIMIRELERSKTEPVDRSVGYVKEAGWETLFLEGPSTTAEMVRERLAMAARSGGDRVFISGERGVGRRAAARFIHETGPRPNTPYIILDCSNPDGLASLRSILVRGGQSTLLLHEVTSLTRDDQIQLFEMLKNRAEGLAGPAVICTASSGFHSLLESGEFFQDLYYRLGLYPIEIPPLGARAGDIEVLSRKILKALEPEVILAPSAVKALERYPFPGNVAELELILQRAALLCDRMITPDLLMLPVRPPKPADRRGRRGAVGEHEIEKMLLVLDEVRWNRRLAARKLGISYDALRWRLQKYNLLSAD